MKSFQYKSRPRFLKTGNVLPRQDRAPETSASPANSGLAIVARYLAELDHVGVLRVLERLKLTPYADRQPVVDVPQEDLSRVALAQETYNRAALGGQISAIKHLGRWMPS